MTEIWQTILTGFLILLGLAGSVLPILPGPPIAWAGLLIYGITTDFSEVTLTGVMVFGAFTALVVLFDMFAPVLGARGYKASRLSVVLSIIGVFAGIFILPPFGFIFGPLAGAYLGEYWTHRDEQKALKVAWGSFVGFLLGTAAKLVLVLAIAVYFVAALF